MAAAPAGATQPIQSFGVSTSSTQAGAHPDLSASFTLAEPGQPEAAESVVVNLPEGVFGNPNAVPTCTVADFALFQCPLASQVGTVTVRANYEGDPEFLMGTAPLYDVDVQVAGETARLGFVVPTINLPISVPVQVRTGSDYGLRLTVAGITQLMPLAGADVDIWGYPAENANANERFLPGKPGSPAGCPGQSTALCASNNGQTPHISNTVEQPLTDNPSTCTGEPLTVSLDVRTYQDPTQVSHAEDQYPPTSGCDQQTFKPVLNVGLTSTEADSPSGIDITLRAAQLFGRSPSPSTIRSAQVLLPTGLSINPDAADGQTACTDAEANFGSEAAAACPNGSKIGRFEIHTPALIGPLTGSLYIGEPTPGNQYRLFMVASGFGINAKIVASVHPDPANGRLTVSVTDLPQVPFEELELHVFASDRGLIATPTQCTVYLVDSNFVPWNSTLAPQRSRPNVSISEGAGGRPCSGQVRPFSPRLVAGTTNPLAGGFSSFSLKLDRDDGDQYLRDLNFTMPPGLTGSLRGISYCSEDAIRQAALQLGRTEEAYPSCRRSSQIGTSNVAAGPGGHPFHVVGRMYLAGPFKGGPLSLVVITPAVAGPYDYGTQVVRVAIHVDPLDAHVSAVSDSLPLIIGGVPLRMRTIKVNIDKPDFMINPTNCAEMSIASQGIGDQGSVAEFSSYFHAVNCARLAFKPRMTVKQIGSKGTRRSANPKMQFDLWTRKGDANIKALTVTLPPAFAVDQRHLGNICSERELAGRQMRRQDPDREGLDIEPASGSAAGRAGLRRLRRGRAAAARLHPRRPGPPRAAGADDDDHHQERRRQAQHHGPGGPRRADRPLPPHRLRRQERLPDQHARPLREAADDPRPVLGAERQDRVPERQGRRLGLLSGRRPGHRLLPVRRGIIVTAALAAICFPASASATQGYRAECATQFCGGISADGARAVFPFPEPLTTGPERPQVYERAGGITRSLVPYPSDPPNPTYAALVGLSEDVRHVFVSTNLSLAADDRDGGASDVYDLSEGKAMLLSTGPADPQAGPPSMSMTFLEASSDGRRVLLSGWGSFVAEDVDNCPDIYERFEGTTRLVSTGPAATPVYPAPQCDLPRYGGISVDGSRLFFSTDDHLVAGDPGGDDIYQRVGDALAVLTTYPEGERNCVDRPEFGDASADGGTVLFATAVPVSADDHDTTYDVYKRRPDGTFALVSRGSEGGIGPCGFAGDRPVALSVDGSTSIFETAARLSSADRDSSVDLYRADDSGAISLVTTGPADAGVDEPVFASPAWPADVSDDARSVAFETVQPLVAGDKDRSRRRVRAHRRGHGAGLDRATRRQRRGPGGAARHLGGRPDGRLLQPRTADRGRHRREGRLLPAPGRSAPPPARPQLRRRPTPRARAGRTVLLSAESIPPRIRLAAKGRLSTRGERRSGSPARRPRPGAAGVLRLSRRRGAASGPGPFRIAAGRRARVRVRLRAPPRARVGLRPRRPRTCSATRPSPPGASPCAAARSTPESTLRIARRPVPQLSPRGS